jgi:hypothetical protein
MDKEKYCGEVYLELTFWSNVCLMRWNIIPFLNVL